MTLGDPLAPRRRFEALIAAGEADLDLAEASLVIAQEEYPLLDPAPYLAKLGEISDRVRRLIADRSDPSACIAALNQALFDDEGFSGNETDYYDPRNSFLNEVMDRRTGIPITLSLLYMETARRAGLPVVGIGLPGHFIVRYLVPGRHYWIDPFHHGALMSEADCKEKVQRIYGGKMPFRSDYLKPVTGFAMLSRLLYNLKNIYVESKSYAKALAVIDKLVLLNPGRWEEIRDRGIVRYQLKSYSAALGDLETYLLNVPRSEDRQDLMDLARLISHRLAKPAEE